MRSDTRQPAACGTSIGGNIPQQSRPYRSRRVLLVALATGAALVATGGAVASVTQDSLAKATADDRSASNPPNATLRPIEIAWESRGRVFGRWRWTTAALEPQTVALTDDARLPFETTVTAVKPLIRGAAIVTKVALRNPNPAAVRGALAYSLPGFHCSETGRDAPVPLVITLPANGTLTTQLMCVVDTDPGRRVRSKLTFVPTSDSGIAPTKSAIATRINRNPAKGSRGASIVVKDTLRRAQEIETIVPRSAVASFGVRYSALLELPGRGVPCQTVMRTVRVHDTTTDERLASSNRVPVQICRPAVVATSPRAVTSPAPSDEPRTIVAPSPRETPSAEAAPSEPKPTGPVTIPGLTPRETPPAGAPIAPPPEAGGPTRAPDPGEPPSAGSQSPFEDPDAPPTAGAG